MLHVHQIVGLKRVDIQSIEKHVDYYDLALMVIFVTFILHDVTYLGASDVHLDGILL